MFFRVVLFFDQYTFFPSSGVFTKLGNFRLSSDRLTSCAIYPDETIDILASGDVKGGLGVMVIQPEAEGSGVSEDLRSGPVGRSCSFNVHSKQLNHVMFDNNNASKVFSCSEVIWKA